MSSAQGPVGSSMTGTYTFDIFTSLDGSASYGPPGDWDGYWGKQGPEFLEHRLTAYDGEQRMVFGATTFGLFLQMLPALGADQRDPWMDRMLSCPATVRIERWHQFFAWVGRAIHRYTCRMCAGASVTRSPRFR